MSTRGVKLDRDGNGGWNINIQTIILKKWGPIWLLLFIAVSSISGRVGGELWGLILENRRTQEKVLRHDEDIRAGQLRDSELAGQIEEVRREVRADLREIKQAVRSIETAIRKDG